jgi:hypothetical protein
MRAPCFQTMQRQNPLQTLPPLTLNSSFTASTAGHNGRGLLGGDAGGGGMLLPPSLHLSACHIGTKLATSCMSGEADCRGTCLASCLLSMSWTEASTSRVQVL